MGKTNNSLKVLLIDPCFHDRGISIPYIPLSIGLIGSYLKHHIPEVELKIMKLASDIVKYIKTEKPDVLGVSTYVWNSNLGNKISRLAREVNPELLLVFGGPDINTKPVDMGLFIKKYAQADLLVADEGEVAFTNIIKTYLDVGRNRKKLRNRIEELGNCFYINETRGFTEGPELPRIQELNDVPSPYLMGFFDDLLANRNIQPTVQTNRGCPYSCTFCLEGNSYFSKVKYHSLDYVIEELDYIAKRVDSSVGLLITDSNWGMYRQDVAIAEHLRKLQDTKNWPMFIYASTGKSQLERVEKVVKLLNGAFTLSNSVQSMENDVLKIIKRKNLNEIEKFIEKLSKVSQEPELILPLPGETKESFISGVNKILDTKASVRVQIHPTMLLSNTGMNDEDTIKRYGFKTKFQQQTNLMRHFDGEFICETEKIVVSTSTMSEEDVLDCNVYRLLLETMLRYAPVNELFLFLDSMGMKRSDFMLALINSISDVSDIAEYIEEYRKSIREERFDTEEEVIRYMEQVSKDYEQGLRGGGNLKYSMVLWIECYESMMSWIFQVLRSLLEPDNETLFQEAQALEDYLRSFYYDRSEPLSNPATERTLKFDYDFLTWSQTAPTQPLHEFKRSIIYTFKATSLSTSSKNKIWQSFGFHRKSNYTGAPGNIGRLYMSKIRRDIESLPHTMPEISPSSEFEVNWKFK